LLTYRFQGFEVVAVDDHVARVFAHGGIRHCVEQPEGNLVGVVHDGTSSCARLSTTLAIGEVVYVEGQKQRDF
jgi:hypothetical protein